MKRQEWRGIPLELFGSVKQSSITSYCHNIIDNCGVFFWDKKLKIQLTSFFLESFHSFLIHEIKSCVYQFGKLLDDSICNFLNFIIFINSSNNQNREHCYRFFLWRSGGQAQGSFFWHFLFFNYLLYLQSKYKTDSQSNLLLILAKIMHSYSKREFENVFIRNYFLNFCLQRFYPFVNFI